MYSRLPLWPDACSADRSHFAWTPSMAVMLVPLALRPPGESGPPMNTRAVRQAGVMAHHGRPDQLRDRFRGALAGVAVGDALGAAFEGHPGPVSSDQIAGAERGATTMRYTDDTAMTIVLAESLLHVGDLDEDHLALSFAAEFRRRPDRGYGPGTASVLDRIAGGEAWRQVATSQFEGKGSLGNGAAMRVTPVALYAAGDPALTGQLARRSARVTHTHPLGVEGAALQAAAVALALTQPDAHPLDPDSFLEALRQVVAEPVLAERLDLVAALLRRGDAEDVAAVIGTGVAASEAVPAAICAFLRHPDSFPDVVRFAISLGGDTDTIASMAGAMAGARLGEDNIPRSCLERTEGALFLGWLGDCIYRRRRRVVSVRYSITRRLGVAASLFDLMEW